MLFSLSSQSPKILASSFSVVWRRNLANMAAKLEPLPDVARLSGQVFRILGQNPSVMTLQGTNTYVLSPPEEQSSGSEPLPAILIDAGQGEDEYIPILEKFLEGRDDSTNKKRLITDIVLTHRHFDHTAGLPSVLGLLQKLRGAGPPPKIHKFPHPADQDIEEVIAEAPEGSYEKDKSSNKALRSLNDGTVVGISEKLQDKVTLKVVHSPGHDLDHCCFYLEQEQRLFTGDHVLGQGTSVFSDLGAYMRSLKKCSDLLDKSSSSDDKEVLLYPAHGPTIVNGKAMLKQYYAHRLERENQVLELLAKDAPNGDGKEWTIQQITENLYAKYPEAVWPQAARGLFLHLHKLGTSDPDAPSSAPHGGQRVKCNNTSDGLAPPVPTHQDGFERWRVIIEEYKWTLLSNSQTGKL